MASTGNFRPGVAASSDCPPVVFTLGRKSIPAAIGRAMTAICGPMLPRKPWNEPWLDPRHWMDLKEPKYRLNFLHKTLVAWAHIYCNNVHYAKQQGLSPSRIQWLKGQKIDPKKVLKAIKILSA